MRYQNVQFAVLKERYKQQANRRRYIDRLQSILVELCCGGIFFVNTTKDGEITEKY